ncbi:3-sulfolactaldehyde reductase [Methylobacterium crusticola]|uniref:3-sulfolactaldehyde reductase n=1 Tax=Methylobacterium crusticola TaxID=1697972 RepID=A0ABQ4R7J7_9HYPH|nr:NAD(P)-binding domain-containing protein [Methylobacterium crusticola]GJD53668.1 3-sulfolactaldehyde reductase [Methylobacterium crusticola]
MDLTGFVGLGRMGRPMASNLCRKGFRLVVHDIDPRAAAEVAALQARAAGNVAEVAAEAGIIVTMLPNSAVVDAVVAGPEGILAHARPGSLIMDMSTVDPLTTDRLAAEAARRGVAYVDAPVGRLASHADRGESLFMVGAEAADFARVRPLLEAMGTTIYHCGPVGAGTRTKLVNNYLAVTSCQLNAEALALSQRLGLDLERTLDVLYGTTAVNGQLKIAWPAKVLRGDVEPGFTIDLAHKDLSLIVEAANAARVPMPVAAAAREAFSAARASGFGGQDFSAMVDALCALAGIEKPRLKAPPDAA